MQIIPSSFLLKFSGCIQISKDYYFEVTSIACIFFKLTFATKLKIVFQKLNNWINLIIYLIYRIILK